MITSLQDIGSELEALEEEIIFSLMKRAQLKLNPTIYELGNSGFPEKAECLLDLRLADEEKMDAKYGRFTAPEERPFTDVDIKPERRFLRINSGLFLPDPEIANVTADITPEYMTLVREICEDGTDGHFGSSVERDVEALRIISQRIHYGALYVAERKFLDDPETYTNLVLKEDEEGIMEKLTRKDIEDDRVFRIERKVRNYQSCIEEKSKRKLLEPEVIGRFYRDVIISLTKKGEVAYLMQRI